MKSISAMAESECPIAFEAYVGVSYESSRFISSSMGPTEQSWTTDNDRAVVCILYTDSATEGSAKGRRE
jgi:hypothetical protein